MMALPSCNKSIFTQQSRFFTKANKMDEENPLPSLLVASCLLLTLCDDMSEKEIDHVYRTADDLISTAQQRNGKAWDKTPETYPLR